MVGEYKLYFETEIGFKVLKKILTTLYEPFITFCSTNECLIWCISYSSCCICMITIQLLVFIDIKSSTKLLQNEMLAKFPNVPIEWG